MTCNKEAAFVTFVPWLLWNGVWQNSIPFCFFFSFSRGKNIVSINNKRRTTCDAAFRTREKMWICCQNVTPKETVSCATTAPLPFTISAEKRKQNKWQRNWIYSSSRFIYVVFTCWLCCSAYIFPISARRLHDMLWDFAQFSQTHTRAQSHIQLFNSMLQLVA